jgi:hypothetical protein
LKQDALRPAASERVFRSQLFNIVSDSALQQKVACPETKLHICVHQFFTQVSLPPQSLALPRMFHFCCIANSGKSGSLMILHVLSSSINRRSSKLLPFFAAMALLGSNVSIHAASIVSDGGFESAGGGNEYFAGSSLDGGSWTVTRGAVFIDSGDPYVFAGNNSLNLTGVNPYTVDTVSQTLSTIAGDFYTLNFWANSDSANAFSVLVNGAAVSGAPTSIVDNGFPGSVTNSSLFVDYSETFKATSSATTLSFSDTSNPAIGNLSQSGSVLLDNVSVQLAPAPEPASIALMSTGIIALAFIVGRKRLLQPAIAG